ncbi:hypothetical protein BSQ39_12220 [Loigolactobacillus backii]|nr:hypothetical protein BSQ39_12220 [Loigolactobacillus backii]
MNMFPTTGGLVLDYEQLMLTKTDYSFYQFYELLDKIRPAVYTVNELAVRTEMSYQKTYNMVQDINQQVQAYLPEQKSFLTEHGGVDTRKLFVSLDRYRFEIIQANLPFKLLWYMLTTENPTIEIFCKDNDVSKSTVFRKLKLFNDFLKRFKLHMRYKNLAIVGDERYTRLVLYQVMRITAREQSINIFPPELREEVQQVHNLIFQNIDVFEELHDTEDIDFVVAIFLLREHHGFYVNNDSRYQALTAENPNYNIDVLAPMLDVPENRLAGELNFAFFLLNYPPIFRDANSNFLQRTLRFYSRTENIIWSLVTDCLKVIQHNDFNDEVDLTQDRLLLGNLLNTTLGSYILRGPFPAFTYVPINDSVLRFGKNKLYLDIDYYFNHLPQNFRAFSSVKDQLINAFYQFIMRNYVSYDKNYQLKIGLYMEESNLTYQDYRDLLNGIPYFKVAPYFTKFAEQYDVVVTTSASLYRKHAQRGNYFFFDVETSDILGGLYQQLQTYYAKHILGGHLKNSTSASKTKPAGQDDTSSEN